MPTQNRRVRTHSFNVLADFLARNTSLDIVIACPVLGKAIFWDVPCNAVIEAYQDEQIINLSIEWKHAKKQEMLKGSFSIEDLPTDPFSTKYQAFHKGNRSPFGPISFDTGGGYRYMFFFNVFGHSDEPNQIGRVIELAEEERRYMELS